MERHSTLTREQIVSGGVKTAIAVAGAAFLGRLPNINILGRSRPSKFEMDYKGPPLAVVMPDNINSAYWSNHGNIGPAIETSIRPRAEAAGVQQMWHPTLNSFYPGDPDIASRVVRMRRLTDSPNGLQFLDRASRRIAREYYGMDAPYDNQGFAERFQIQKLAIAQQGPNYELFRRGFGYCHARTAWALRDAWPFRQPGSELEGFPGLVLPSLREMVEMMLPKYFVAALAYYSDDPGENKRAFIERLLNDPRNDDAAFSGDFPLGEAGSWLSHVVAAQRRQDGYWLNASRAGAPYQWLHESAMRDAMKPLDFSDRDDPPQAPEGMKQVVQGLEYANPYYCAPFASFLYYGTDLPARDQVKFPPYFSDGTY